MSKTIILIDNSENISELKKFSKLKNFDFYSLNHATHNKLKLEKLDHKIGDNYQSIEDRTLIDDFTINLTANWYKHPLIKDYLIFETTQDGKVYSQTMEVVAKQHNTPLVDIPRAFAERNNQELFNGREDPIHPNSLGHRIIAEELYVTVSKILF